MANRRWFAAADDGDLDYMLVHYQDMLGKQDYQFLDRTALMFAANRGHVEVCELLALGNPNELGMINRRGNTALHFAASGGHTAIIKMLAPFEARMRNENGDTALTHAINNGHIEAVRLLLPYELDVLGSCDRLPLDLARHLERSDIVRVIEEYTVSSQANPKTHAVESYAPGGSFKPPSTAGLIKEDNLTSSEFHINDVDQLPDTHLNLPIPGVSSQTRLSTSNLCDKSGIKGNLTGMSAHAGSNVSVLSGITPLNSAGDSAEISAIGSAGGSAEGSAAGSYQEPNPFLTCNLPDTAMYSSVVSDAKLEKHGSTASLMARSLPVKTHTVGRSNLIASNISYSCTGDEESDYQSLAGRTALLEKANNQLRSKNARHVITMMELEDRNKTLTGLLEVLLKPESYADEFTKDQASGSGHRQDEKSGKSNKPGTAEDKNRPITLEESRHIHLELKALREENKMLRDMLYQFAEKFDTYMLATNFYATG